MERKYGTMTVWKDHKTIDQDEFRFNISQLFQGVLLYITSTYICNIMFCHHGGAYITFNIDGEDYHVFFHHHEDWFVYNSKRFEYSDPMLFDKLDELLKNYPKRIYS